MSTDPPSSALVPDTGDDRVGPGGQPSSPPISGTPGVAVTSNLETILNSIKLAGDMMQNVPYIGFIADIMSQILKIKDEVTACKEKWKEVMNDIDQIRKIVEDYAPPSVKAEGAASLTLSDDIQEHLRKLEKLLADIVRALSRCSAKRKRDHIRIALQRRELQTLVDNCKMRLQSELVFFNTRINLSNNRMLQRIPHDASQIKVLSKPIKIKYTLPMKPQIMHGRDDIIAELVAAILHGSAARLALLGPGGIGKTSIALSVLHHDDVQKIYKDACYFLACDAIESRDALIISIAQMLGISADTKQNLDEACVFDAVTNLGRAIICLDNFETVWETQSSEVEDFLSKLAAINSIHLVITMRGEEYPWNISWTSELPPIKPLDLDAAMQVFYDISHYNDECAQNLVKAVDCVPLAVTLLAHYTRYSTSEKVWKQWSAEHFKILSRKQAEHNRLSSVEYSIELSLKSPKLKDPQCLQILSILSIIPDGIYESQEEDIQYVLGFQDPISDSLQTLKNCALISEAVEHGRLKLLSPISLYMRKHHPFQEINKDGYKNLKGYIIYWLTCCSEKRNNRDIRTDANNLRTLLQHYLHFDDEKSVTIYILLTFCQTSMLEGINEIVTLSKCESDIQNINSSTLSIFFHHVYAKMCMRFDDIHGAHNQLVKAMILAEETDNTQLQGDIHYTMGDYFNRLDQLYKAREHLENAVKQHIQAHSILEQAHDLQLLGELNVKLNNLDAAKEHLEEALRLHIQTQSIIGQANDLRELGELSMRLDELDTAKDHLEEALKLHTQVQNVIGQADLLRKLAQLDMRQDKPDAAKKHLQEALKLHIQSQSILGQAYDLIDLGKLNAIHHNFSTAKECFEEALKLHTQAQDISGQADDLRELGQVEMRLKNLDAARICLLKALKLHIQAQDTIGHANDLLFLAELDMMENKSDTARENLEKALKLAIQAQDILGQANIFQLLGRLDIKLDDLDAAKGHLEKALKLHIQAQNIFSQANDLRHLGILHIRRDEPDAAKEYFEEALQLHTQSQDTLGQAEDLYCLGLWYFAFDQPHEAHEFLSRALQLHKQTPNPAAEARDALLLQQVEAKLRLENS